MAVALGAFAILAASSARRWVRAGRKRRRHHRRIARFQWRWGARNGGFSYTMESQSELRFSWTPPPSEEQDEFIRRGLPHQDEAAKQIRELKSLGVTDIVRISPLVDGTEEEVEALPPWCDEHKLQSIVFVAHTDHTR
jgi:hypothetical protein